MNAATLLWLMRLERLQLKLKTLRLKLELRLLILIIRLRGKHLPANLARAGAGVRANWRRSANAPTATPAESETLKL